VQLVFSLRALVPDVRARFAFCSVSSLPLIATGKPNISLSNKLRCNPSNQGSYNVYRLLWHQLSLHSAHRVYLYVWCDSQNIQGLYPYITLTTGLHNSDANVFLVRYELNVEILCIGNSCESLKWDSKIWSWVLRDLDPRGATLARPRYNCTSTLKYPSSHQRGCSTSRNQQLWERKNNLVAGS
jgi:hypothetical protein